MWGARRARRARLVDEQERGGGERFSPETRREGGVEEEHVYALVQSVKGALGLAVLLASVRT